MADDGILTKVKGQYSVKDVEKQQVEVVKVLAVDELNDFIEQQVNARTAALTSEVEQLKAQLSEAQGGGLEQAAADAALEAEAKALEAKAEAEQRAEAAEARVKELELQLQQSQSLPPLEEEKEPEPEPEPEGITEDDHDRARRLADTLIQDLIDEEEEKAQASLAAGTFRDDFADDLKGARRTYDRRTPDGVQAERDHWEESLAKFEEDGKG